MLFVLPAAYSFIYRDGDNMKFRRLSLLVSALLLLAAPMAEALPGPHHIPGPRHVPGPHGPGYEPYAPTPPGYYRPHRGRGYYGPRAPRGPHHYGPRGPRPPRP